MILELGAPHWSQRTHREPTRRIPMGLFVTLSGRARQQIIAQNLQKA
jgi:hypothetical protein